MSEIREGVAIAAGVKDNKSLAQLLEQAMAAEVAACYAEGMLDPEVIRARMLAAKEQARHEYENPATEE